MTLHLDPEFEARLAGANGDGMAMAARLVAGAARLLGADKLVVVESAHIDGCLYHGKSGVEFAARLAQTGARVCIPTTLNVGATDLLTPARVLLDQSAKAAAFRLRLAYESMGCRPTWTCAPYQAGHRPALGAHVAWGESNAVAFANSVLGARTNRLGDLLDIACALTGRAPLTGLHLDQNRQAKLVLDLSQLPRQLLQRDDLAPVLGTLLGEQAGTTVAAIIGLTGPAGDAIPEDKLKALGAAAASAGGVALFHIVGTTPEAPTLDHIAEPDTPRIVVDVPMLTAARDRLSTSASQPGDAIDAVAVGSPHLSTGELHAIAKLMHGRHLRVPFYACTGMHAWSEFTASGDALALTQQGLIPVIGTCVVVTPILPAPTGALMTNSGKFAWYAPGTTGWATVFGSLTECVESAVAGRLVRDHASWC